MMEKSREFVDAGAEVYAPTEAETAREETAAAV